jgi:hypothetical protein
MVEHGAIRQHVGPGQLQAAAQPFRRYRHQQPRQFGHAASLASGHAEPMGKDLHRTRLRQHPQKLQGCGIVPPPPARCRVKDTAAADGGWWRGCPDDEGLTGGHRQGSFREKLDHGRRARLQPVAIEQPEPRRRLDRAGQQPDHSTRTGTAGGPAASCGRSPLSVRAYSAHGDMPESSSQGLVKFYTMFVLFVTWANGMSLLPNLLEKSLLEKSRAAAPGMLADAGRRLSARKALLVWIVLMSALWLLLGAGVYTLIGTGE